MVDYCSTDISKNPSCSHGPTLLFCRKNSMKKFYACSAFRSRKQCPFFLWEEDNRKRKSSKTKSQTCQFEFSKVQKITELPAQDRNWCHSCESLFSLKDKFHHQKHKTEIGMNDEVLSQPSMLFIPREQSKGESQYYFSDTSVTTIVGFLRSLNVTATICLGCPRLHEYNLRNNVMKSMLLDIDSRYLQFYNPDEFQPFNMFNGHAYDGEGWMHIERFLDSGKIAIIADPPFGAQTGPLAYTFQRLKSLKKDTNVIEFLILPYFMEPVVLKSFPNYSMLDYKVVYINHRKFKKHDALTKSSKSAVRIFTDVDLSKFQFPAEDYKYCSICNRWVCKENEHCDKCNACTSKNGARYSHCDLCGKCFKSTWKHCEKCRICKLVEHRCISSSCGNEEIEKNSPKKRKNKSFQKKKTKVKRVH